MRVLIGDRWSECYECNKRLSKKPFVLIGEHSHEFREDTCQAAICIDCLKRICIDCLKRGIQKIEDEYGKIS